MSNSFKKALNVGMEQLVATVTPRIRPVLDSVATISYELSESEYADNEVNDPWVQRLLHAVETNVAWLQPLMTANNYDSFVHLAIDFIVKRLEVIMMQKRFSQLGGLQLDRDARALVSHFSSMTQRTVRDKFARLLQMATILNLEKASEILDFWGENSGPMTWRLIPAEVVTNDHFLGSRRPLQCWWWLCVVEESAGDLTGEDKKGVGGICKVSRLPFNIAMTLLIRSRSVG
ncbi:hypothetical protein F0562_032536 [Nyssa sinensis]|uniref:Conserved oligomeric Golgi complex subunit 4 C-terminal domain-containing protein n=1 Tax=Nyssa sinensis TaxID=561372 RepID=A0A5J5AQY5_9ASTE|nr:hypothetical protein F0562_032536 [Nyssa sinensis]